ncbi:hypothetical protein LEMLEM_LOCUS21464, partial [Lemmus lemmus]
MELVGQKFNYTSEQGLCPELLHSPENPDYCCATVGVQDVCFGCP